MGEATVRCILLVGWDSNKGMPGQDERACYGMGKLGLNVSITIPVHSGCNVGRGLAVRILKDAGFSVEEYLRLR